MTETAAGAGVLSGIKVVDFGHFVAGPLTAVMLADQGAQVVHVDRPGAELTEADAFLNRGKRRITLDLKDPADAAIAARLAAGADVVIENFRPGVMDRLGLGWPQLGAAAPQLIYCSLPGFGHDDPRAQVPGWEGVLAAATANCSIRVGQEPPGWDTSRPTYSAVPLASNFAAFLAATAIVAALTFRHRTGRGQLIEVPLFHAMFELIGKAGSFVQADGLAPPKPHSGNGSGTYECADGRYVRLDPIGGSARFLRWLLDAAGAESWAADGLTDGVRLAQHKDLEARLKERLRGMFLTRTAEEWGELAGDAGVPLAFIRTCREWIRTPHARAAGHVVSVADPLFGATWMPGLPVHTAASSSWTPVPRQLPDADHDAVVAEASQQAATAPAARPAEDTAARPAQDITRAFEGLRVLDLTEILAGPTSGRILGEYGADVVKINAPSSTVTAHGIVNRGKRSILLNVEAERGQGVFWELAARSDVIIQNYPEGTADRYGIGYRHVRARFPDAVFVSVTCYGEGGLWGARRGYEVQGQAVTGMMERAGGDHHVPEVLGPYNVVDFGSGVMTAFAASLGIFHRTRTGAGGLVTASLAQTATYHQATFMLDYPGRQHNPEPRGPEALGSGPFQRYYQVRDGWIFLGMKPSQWPALQSVPWLTAAAEVSPADAPSPDDEGAVEAALSAALAEQSAAEAVQALREAGVGAHEVLTTEQVMTSEPARKLGLSLTQESEEFGPVVMPGLTVRLSESPLVLGRAAGRAGSDAESVLVEVGLAGRITELSRAWVLRTEDLPRAW
jgi:crotonobetainyl-CoA:carnitine CoA-transferase CaiB-like acyl-CoA transferase